MLTCPVNVSEGRDPAVLDALRRAGGAQLVDLHADIDHHRSVLTLADPVAVRLLEALGRLARTVVAHVDLARHEGVHPRLGALDVVPFVALDPTPHAAAVRAARDASRLLSAEFGIPVFRYDDAAPDHRSLPTVRRGAFRDLLPDLGPERPHPQAGATAVGARRPLVALNLEVDLPRAVAASVAAAVRAAGGGMPGVRALAFRLPRRGVTQVSLNVTDLARTSVEEAVMTVRDLVGARGGTLGRVELVGLVPDGEWRRWSGRFRRVTGLDVTCTVEYRCRIAEGRAVPLSDDRDPAGGAPGPGPVVAAPGV